MIAIGALIISLINSVFTARTYKKNRRLEFLQRRDYLSQKISDLNDRNTEAHLISARYALVAVKSAGLQLQGEHAKQNLATIATISNIRDKIEKGIELWDESIEKLHTVYRNLTLETDAPEVERIIAIVQVASDKLKFSNDGFLSSLHILETTNEFMKVKLAETDEQIKQINIDFEKALEKPSNE